MNHLTDLQLDTMATMITEQASYDTQDRVLTFGEAADLLAGWSTMRRAYKRARFWAGVRDGLVLMPLWRAIGLARPLPERV